MIVSVHQPQYIPWLGYFDKIDKSDCFVFLDKVQYKSREFQNRNKIRTKDGILWLTVPVISKGRSRQGISEVRIDDTVDWRRRHLGGIKSWYGRSRFLKDHIDFFEDVYGKSWEKLIDLNMHIIRYILKAFNIKTPLYNESVIGTTSKSTDRIIEICGKLRADTYLSGAGGRAYLEEEKFGASGIKLEYQDFKHPVYRQMYAAGQEPFFSFMSAIDLLFNEGYSSGEIMRGGK